MAYKDYDTDTTFVFGTQPTAWWEPLVLAFYIFLILVFFTGIVLMLFL